MNRNDKKALLDKIDNSPKRDELLKSIGYLTPTLFIKKADDETLNRLKSDVDKSYNKPRELIIEYPGIKVYKNFRWVTFNGCQCFKDCTCKEDFKPFWRTTFSVESPFGMLNNLDDVKLDKLLKQLNNLEWINKPINIKL